jgi:DNA-binding NarL/FixJ family response regulator
MGAQTITPLRIFLVEDHETVREGLKLLIDNEPDLRVVGEASDGLQAMSRPDLSNLDVVVMDLSLPGVSGIVATRALKDRRPDLAVVCLTRHADRTFVEELLKAGASGYVLKQSPCAELLRAVRSVARGQPYVDPALTHHLAASFASHDPRTPRGKPITTVRENEVLRLAARGYGNKQIAAKLGVSFKTIEVHKANAMRKLGLNGKSDLLQYGLHHGWLQIS